MAAVVFALVLAGLLFWLEQESCVHSLDDLQGLLETEDFLAEADQPVNLQLTVRNSGPTGSHLQPCGSIWGGSSPRAAWTT